jgi:hypothetical protein
MLACRAGGAAIKGGRAAGSGGQQAAAQLGPWSVVTEAAAAAAAVDAGSSWCSAESSGEVREREQVTVRLQRRKNDGSLS